MSPDWPGQRPTAVMVTWGLLSILITLPGPLSSTFSRRGDRGREVKAVPRTHNWKGTKMRPPVLDVFHLPLGSNTTFSTLLHAPRAWPYGLHQWLPHPPPSHWLFYYLAEGNLGPRKYKRMNDVTWGQSLIRNLSTQIIKAVHISVFFDDLWFLQCPMQ